MIRRMTLIEKFVVAFICVISYAALSNADQVVRIAPLTISVRSSNVTVNGTATALPSSGLVGRESIAVKNLNTSTTTLYIGNVNVTTANGFPLDSATPSIVVDIDDSVILYGITNGSSVSARLFEAK